MDRIRGSIGVTEGISTEAARIIRPERTVSLSISRRRILLILGDLAVISIAAILSEVTRSGGALAYPLSTSELFLLAGWLVTFPVLWFLVAGANECYDVRTAGDFSVTSRRVILSLTEMAVVCIVVLYFTQLNLLPRGIFLVFFLSSLALLLSWRFLYWTVFRRPLFKLRVLIVGAGWAGRTIVREMQRSLRQEYDLLGFVDDDPDKCGHVIEGVKVLGTRDDLTRLTNELRADEVVLSITHNIHGQLYEALLEVQESDIQVTTMDVLFESLTGRVPVEHLNQYWYSGLPLVPNEAGVYVLCKRLVDILISLAGLFLIGVVALMITIANRFGSPGPMFYYQDRVGRNGKVFRLVKFRSMVVDAEADGKAVWATENDNRVTKLGRLLRITRADELPQFLNVLRGEMSVVGPRPERPSFVEDLQRQIPLYRARLGVKPGLTGWAQVKYRYGNTVEDSLVKLQYDLYYLKRQSLFLDLLICLRTFWVVISCKGT